MKKKVLFLHPDLRGGGAEKVLVSLLNGLNKEKYDITLFTIFEEGSNRKDLQPFIRQQHLFKKVFRGYSVLQKFFPPSFLFNRMLKEKYDIIVAYLEGVPTRIVSGCTDKDTKLISWLHIKIDETGIEKVFGGLPAMKQAYSRFDKTACVSETARKSLISYVGVPAEKAVVIHNSIETQHILQAGNGTMAFSYPTDRVNLVTVGRLMPQKGYDRLLNIALRLKNEGILFHIYILGDGDLRAKFENFLKINALESHVTLLGFQTNPYPYVKAADMFVCSSLNEGYSTAVTEAILLEVPVITTDCSGMDEILDYGKSGLIVENNEEALYVGLRNMLLDSNVLALYKAKAVERSAHFKQNKNVALVEDLFDSL